MTSPNSIIADLQAENAALRIERDEFWNALQHPSYEVENELRRQRDELLADVKESDAVRDRLAKLLSETAIALKGEEEALQRHSWHDLPVVALAAMLEITILKQQREELLSALERLSFAAECRDNTVGDACRLIEVRAELAAANKQAVAAISSVKGGS